MMKPCAKVTGDIIVQHAGPNRWIVSNVFTRSHIGVDGRGLNWLDALTSGKTLKGKTVKLWEISFFSNEESLWQIRLALSVIHPSGRLQSP